MNLYHASQNKNLSLLTPQPTMSNDKYIGDYLFATKNYTLAVMYLVSKGIATMMEPGDDPYIVIGVTHDEFKKRDKGGAIYVLPSDTFIDTPQVGLLNYEMVSKVAVRPIKSEVFDCTLYAFKEMNIGVKFIGSSGFNELLNNPKQKEMVDEIPFHDFRSSA